MDWAQILVAVGTWVIAGGTIWLVTGQLSIAKEQRKIQLYLELRKEFDGHLVGERKLLSQQLLHGAPHGEINETVIDFFEDMGMLLRRDFLDRQMIWDTFSYYARMWWSACRDYIGKEREDVGGDETLFTDFDYLVECIAQDDARKRRKSRTVCVRYQAVPRGGISACAGAASRPASAEPKVMADEAGHAARVFRRMVDMPRL